MGMTMILLIAFIRLVGNATIGTRTSFSLEERARGEHCIDSFLYSAKSPLRNELDRRSGTKLNGQFEVSLRDIQLEPMRSDGTHKMTVFYQIDRVGASVRDVKRAIGTLVNSNCSFELTVVQR
jgi:hypothetical protein